MIAALSDSGWTPKTVGTLADVSLLYSSDEPLIIGSDDLVEVQKVVELLYLSTGYSKTLPIIILAPIIALADNPDICTWTINGHAAVATVTTPDGDSIRRIPAFLDHL